MRKLIENYAKIYDHGEGNVRVVIDGETVGVYDTVEAAQEDGYTDIEVVDESVELTEATYDDDEKARIQEFAESIPMEELFDHIKELTGLSDLKFEVSKEFNRNGDFRILFESQDLADRVGFLKLLFKELYISNFGGYVNMRSSGKCYYWTSVTFDYVHPNGGMNGHTFCDVHYEDGQWQYYNE